MGTSVVFMGVSGCGKSSLAAAVAAYTGLALIEGDDFHSPSSREKMSAGVPLTDADRADWLARLGEQLRAHPEGVLLTCSSLKRAYRDQLRAASPGLRFVFLDVDRAEAQRRVASRAAHFFSATLVDNQFATLESPVGEDGVLRVEARAPVDDLQRQVSTWLAQENVP